MEGVCFSCMVRSLRKRTSDHCLALLLNTVNNAAILFVFRINTIKGIMFMLG